MSAPRAAQAPPTPKAPVDGAVVPLDAATFGWAAPPGASSFDLRVASADAPDAPLVELAALEATEVTLADALPPGPCVWWVRQEGGAWSRPARFVAGTPADVEVAQQDAAETSPQREAEPGARREPPSFLDAPPDPVWPHASGPALAGSPALDWSTVPGFGAPVRADVPAVDGDPPRPLGPLGGEVVDAVTVALRWEAVPGAVGYDVELSPHPAFDREVLGLDAGRAIEIALPGLVPAAGHQLLWRVRARTASGATRWSRYGRFYPAGEGAVDRFRRDHDAALVAQRKQREHARLAREREIDLVPLHQRSDAVTTSATVVAIVAIVLSSIVILTIAFLFAALRS